MSSSKAAKKAAAAALSVNLPAGSPPLSKYMLNKLLMQQQAAEGASTGKRGRDATGSGVSSAGVGAVPNAAELYVPKVKRPKVIIPEGELLNYSVFLYRA